MLISWVVVWCLVVRRETGGMEVWWCIANRSFLFVYFIHLLNCPSSACGDVHHALKWAHSCTRRVTLIGARAGYRAHPYTARCGMVVLRVTLPWWCSLELLDARNVVELWVGKGARVLRMTRGVGRG